MPPLLRRLPVILLLVVAIAPSARSESEVRLPRVFASHMVLQRDRPVPIWGWAGAGESITVRLAGTRVEATADAAGEWRATLPAMEAGGPHVLTVEGSNIVRFEDVLVGEVWLCSGQSNMEMGITACRDAKAEVAAAGHPRIRLLMVPNRFAALPQDDFDASGPGGAWRTCTPQAVAEGGWGGFSAAAYFFGREIERVLDVPVGLIDATWGGTQIQPWTPPEGFAGVPELQDEYERVLLADPRTDAHQERLAVTVAETERWVASVRQAMAERAPVPAMPVFPSELLPPRTVQSATALYNGMIHPICPFAVRGAIWYQGESNLGDGALYTARMRALIGGWRTLWGQGDFPFYFVQIAPFAYRGDPRAEPLLWEAQAAAQSIPSTGMVVINDIGNLSDIHPADKQEVGRRLALWALAKDYGKHVEYSGPTVREAHAEGRAFHVAFDHAGTGLSSRDGAPLTWFELIDAEEGGFVTATAEIRGDAVVLTSPEVDNPVAVRFAWHMRAEPNLVNSAGLPAGSFRAGREPSRDLLRTEVREAQEYTLVYDLDLGTIGPEIRYNVDARESITRPFDRIAYFLERQDASGATSFVYVSMAAFTDDLGKIGVPTLESGAHWQRSVKDMTVISNVEGVATGAGRTQGNLEFWPSNYGPANAAGVTGASDTVFDFGDQPGDPQRGYGCMQVHDHEARQTLFAVNNWKAGASADLGIGNQPSGNPDWTFAANAGAYAVKRLRVLVRSR